MNRVNWAEQIIVALDVEDLADAEAILEDLAELEVWIKVGNQLGTYEGWAAVTDMVHRRGFRIFCDTKFKDIPETVMKSAHAMTRHKPDMFDVMADTSEAALEAAVLGTNIAAKDFGVRRPALLGVTVLTSLSSGDTESIYGAPAPAKVLQFARNAARAGLDGVVCSAEEAVMLSKDPATKELLLVTPGIRPSWAAAGDQRRVTTPVDAIKAGADFLVIGRPIIQPPAEIGSPREAVMKIIEELEEGVGTEYDR